MADNRLPNMVGQSGPQQQTGFGPMANMGMGPVGQPTFVGGAPQQQFAGGMPFYPPQAMNPAMMGGMTGMGQPMYSMQAMRPPSGPPPMYTQQLAANYQHKTRGPTMAASRPAPAKPKTEKERYFEEQQKKLRQFRKPGSQVTDANSLVDNLFGKTDKHGAGHVHTHHHTGADVRAHHHTSADVHTHHHTSADVRTQPNADTGPQTVAGSDLEDDGFGDFLGGPTSLSSALSSTPSSTASLSSSVGSSGIPPQSATGSANQEAAGTEVKSEQCGVAEHGPPVEKKDLMSMMMECSDLNAPQKARGFHKPSLVEVQKSGVHHHHKPGGTHHESDHARRWDNSWELEGLFIVEKQANPAPQPSTVSPRSPTFLAPSTAHPLHPDKPPGGGEGGDGKVVLPDWCKDSGENLPVLYQQVLEAVSDGDSIVTERLYPILVMSGLPREQLGGLWHLANTHNPGHLSRTELWVLLAFVALVQNNYEVKSAAILKRCPQAPVPFLGQPSASASASGQPVSPGSFAQPSSPGVSFNQPFGPAEAVPGAFGQASVANQPIPAAFGQASVANQPIPAAFGQASSTGQPNLGAFGQTSVPNQPVPGALSQASNANQPTHGAFGQGANTGQPIPGAFGQASTAGQPVPGAFAQASVASQPHPGGFGLEACTPVSTGHDGHVEGLGDLGRTVISSHAAMPASSLPSHHLPAPPGTMATPSGVIATPSGAVATRGVAAPQVAVLPTSMVQEDFADFQAAPSPAQHPPQASSLNTAVSRTDDSYGEFIGGTSSSTSEQSLSSVPKEAASKLEQLYNNGGVTMTADEQYNSNVRNFFCSSDSSTAKDSSVQKNPRHTTPNSLDEEDFSDGRDSLSQASTSEQSENEDIKAFENYVQEFNRKRDAKGSSHHTLHGTFPRSDAGGKTGVKGGRGSGKETGSSSTVAKTPPAVNFPIPRLPGAIPSIPSLPGVHSWHSGKGSNTTVVNSTHTVKPVNPTAHTVKAVPAVGREDDDFDDFKSARDVSGEGEKKKGGEGEVVLMGEEDKYSALRTLTTTTLPSLFEGGAEEEEEEWADFAHSVDPAPSQPVVAELSVSETHSVMNVASVADGYDDWADFSTASQSVTAPTALSPPTSTLHVSSIPTTSALHIPSTSTPFTSGGADSWSRFPDAGSGIQDLNQVPNMDFNIAEASHDDWADFASATPKTETDLSKQRVDLEQGTTDYHTMTRGREEMNPDLFPATTTGSTNLSGMFTDYTTTTSSDVFTGVDQSAVLTVKKKNLGTSEIMGVFKVRDDPATLSSYELPKPPVEQSKPHHDVSRTRRHRSRSGSKPHESSPDGEDDFGMGPPPLDSVGDEDDEEFSRGYDLDDIVNPPPPTTLYSPFGFSASGAGYSRSAFTAVNKTSAAGRIHTTDSRPDSVSPHSADTSSLPEYSPSKGSADHHRDSDTGGTDSQSVSSLEFGGSVESGGRVGVSETKSLDSLDLRSGGGGVEEDEEEDGRWGRQGSQPPHPALGANPLADRYNLDGQQVEGSERYAYEWERCLASSCQQIHGANTIFNTISRSSVCNEVLKSPQGSDYVLGLIEVYRVVCRIMTALPTTAVTSPAIEQSLKQIDLAWNNLAAFLVGASLLPDEGSFKFQRAVLSSEGGEQQRACGVCLLDVDHHHAPSEATPTPKLWYGGRQYHAPCANFWVNCVDSMLPALKLPELL